MWWDVHIYPTLLKDSFCTCSWICEVEVRTEPSTLKTNMEPKNGAWEDDVPFLLGDFEVPAVNFLGCSTVQKFMAHGLFPLELGHWSESLRIQQVNWQKWEAMSEKKLIHIIFPTWNIQNNMLVMLFQFFVCMYASNFCLFWGLASLVAEKLR